MSAPSLPPDVPRPDPSWELDVSDEAIAYDGQLHEYWSRRATPVRWWQQLGLAPAAKAWAVAALGAAQPFLETWYSGGVFDADLAGRAVLQATVAFGVAWLIKNKPVGEKP